MSGWDTPVEAVRAWIEQDVPPSAEVGPLDELDAEVLRMFASAAFPGQSSLDETRVDGMVVAPEPEPEGQAFDSMTTVIRAAPERPDDAVSGSLDIALESSDQGLSVGLEAADDEAPTDVRKKARSQTEVAPAISDEDEAAALERAAAEIGAEDGSGTLGEPRQGEGAELFIPTLTRPTPPPQPAISDAFDEESEPIELDPTGGSGTITFDEPEEAEDEAAVTMTRGEIVGDMAPDPVVPKAKIVVDPAASGVYDFEDEDEDEEDDDPEELDAADFETVDDTAPPPGGSTGAPPPAPVAVGELRTGEDVAEPNRPRRKTVIATDGQRPPPAPHQMTHAAPPAAPAATVPAAPEAAPPATPGGTQIKPAEIPPPRPEPIVTGGTLPPTERAWVEDVFGEHYAALLPANHVQKAMQEVEFFVQCAQLPPGSRVLDIGCGSGAHAIALAARGYHVVGFDASSAQVARAHASAEASGVRVQFVHGDMRHPPSDGPFEAALCIGSTFGSLDDDQDQLALQRITERLVPGGTLLLNVFNRDYIVGRLPTRSWWQGQGCLVLDEAQLDSVTSRVKVHRTIVFEDGRQFDHNYELRAYGLNELIAACRRVGLSVVEYAGSTHTRGRFFGASSADIWLMVRRG